MICKLVQTEKGLFSAAFNIYRGTQLIGAVSLQGRLGSMEAAIYGTYYDTEFKMEFGKDCHVKAKTFRPYLITQDSIQVGTIYQTNYNGGMFRKFNFHQMIKKDLIYDLFPISFGNEGSRCPVYCGNIQIAQIEKGCTVYDELHVYDFFAEDKSAGLVSLLFCLYMYVIACYKPGQKLTEAVSKSFSVTTNRLLKEKYNSYFKNGIKE